MKYTFSAILLITAILISISLLPPPLTSNAGILTTTITLSKIQNSCIVNNTNIAIQNENDTLIDATNNWWGMPKGASDQNRAGGDWVGWNITSQPHLTIIPPNCDLSVANWIPFSEQELQNAVMTQLPYTGGLDFALLDIQKGSGVQFSLVAKPEYGGAVGDAYITITPSPDGTLMMLMLDFSRLPADSSLSQIATCSLMPLFLNSLQLVQNKFTQPSQLIEQMVVMDSSLMMLFSPPTEITPEPSPSLAMNYDTSCLPPAIPQPTPTPPSQNEGESGLLIQIPPMEGELELFLDAPIENNTALTQSSLIAGMPDPCDPNEGGWCAFLQLGDVFTSNIEYNKLTSINHTPEGIVQFQHILPSNMSYPSYPSWGNVPNVTNHYRLAFACAITDDNIPSDRVCYWDTASNTFDYLIPETNYTTYSSPHIAPDGSKIAYIATISDGTTYLVDLIIYNFQTQANQIVLSFSTAMYPVQVRWGSSDLLYYSTNSSTTTSLWGYSVNANTSPYEISLGEDVDFVPYLFDIQAINMLYWSYGNDNNYNLNSFGIDNWTISFPSITSSYPRYYPFPVYWSPRVGSQTNDNQAIMLLPTVNGDWCITRFDVTTIDEGGSVIDTGLCLESDSHSDWANGIDLSVLNNQPPPTPTPPPSQFTCLSPDPNPQAQPANINLCIQELAQYGIIAYATGLPTQQPAIDSSWALDPTPQSSQYYSRSWTVSELQQILIGVQNIAASFNSIKNNINDGKTQQAKAIFQAIMGDPSLGNKIYVLRVTGDFTFRSDSPFEDGCYPRNQTQRAKACVYNISGQSAIAFYAQFYNPSPPEPTHDYIQHVVVHEFGHRFDGRVGKLREVVNNQTVEWTFFQYNVFYPATNSAGVKTMVKDCGILPNDPTDDAEVFGLRDPLFTRGVRGWGTIKASGPPPIQQTYFQLNPWEIAGSLEDLGETTADMFLNWVYRRITAGPAIWINCTPQAPFEVGTWSGFRNIDSAGNYDSRLPGNARYKWMEDFMIARFGEQLSTNDNINYVWSPKL